MNKTYNIVWNEARKMYVVASELSRGNSRVKAQVRATAALVMLACGGMMSLPAQAHTSTVIDATVENEVMTTGKQIILNGGVAINVTVNGASWQTVSSGGASISTTLTGGGGQHVSSGGTATATTVNGKKSVQIVHSGGTAISTTLNDMGIQDIRPGGTATSTTVNGGGQQYVAGVATDTLVNRGGEQHVSSGGMATYTMVDAGGVQLVSSGGVATNATVAGMQHISSGGAATSTTLSDFGEQHISSGGTATATMVNDSGTQHVSSGGTATATTVNDWGQQHVSSGGMTTATTVNDGGEQHVLSGGIAMDTRVLNGGTLDVEEAGELTGATIEAGGGLNMQAEGVASDVRLSTEAVLMANTDSTLRGAYDNGQEFSIVNHNARNLIITGGSRLRVLDGGTSTATTVSNGGKLWVDSGGTATDTTVNSGGEQRIYEGVTLAGNTLINEGGTLTLAKVDESGTHITVTDGTILNQGTLTMAGEHGVQNWQLQGSGSLVKTGDGSLILTNASTYTGSTDVRQGTLWLADTGVIGAEGSSQNVLVASNATFGGRGTVNGSVTNSGTVAISNAGETGNTLTINGDYHGDHGTLNINTQLGDDSSPTDRLVITGDATGSTSLSVTNAGGQGGWTTQGIEVVDVGGSSTSDAFTLKGDRMVLGRYEYRLYQDEGDGDWYLRSLAAETPDEPEVPTDPTDPTDPTEPTDTGTPDTPVKPDTPVEPDTPDTPAPQGKPQYRPDIGAYLGNQWMVRNLQMQSLNDREASQLRSADGGIWMRFKAGSADSTAAGGSVDIHNNYSQIQLGGDVLAWDNGEQSVDVGLMAGYVSADTDSTGNRGADGSRFSADGSVDGYSLGVYATWFADAKTHRGLYIDSGYQYGFYNNSVNNGATGSTDYDSASTAVSLETGYRHDIALADGNTVSLTPQTQIIWQDYAADSVKDRSGTRIDGQDGDSWTTRLGLRVDGRVNAGAGIIQPFAEANWLHSSDEVSVAFDGANVDMALPADRAQLKAGVQVNIGSQWSVTGQVSGEKGSDDYSDISGSLNVCYTW